MSSTILGTRAASVNKQAKELRSLLSWSTKMTEAFRKHEL